MLLGHICELEIQCCPRKLEKVISHPSVFTPKFNAYAFISAVLNIIMKVFIHLLNISFLLLEEEILIALRLYDIIQLILYTVFQLLFSYSRLHAPRQYVLFSGI